MKNMKKIFAVILSTALLISTAACANEEVIIASGDDLVGKKIGVQQGTTGAIFAADIENATVEQYNKGADAIMALTQKKVDAVIIDNEPAKVYVEKNAGIKILDDPFAVEEYAACIAKENSALTIEFNSAISALKADGTLDKILDYYINGVEGAAPYQRKEVDRPNGTLKMVTNAAFPPYEYWEGDKICGLDADFAQAICDYLGYELEIEDIDFDSIIASIQSGKADFGMAGMTVTEERLQNVDFTNSYCTGTQVIIVRE